jgi:hypothetical protein
LYVNNIENHLIERYLIENHLIERLLIENHLIEINKIEYRKNGINMRRKRFCSNRLNFQINGFRSNGFRSNCFRSNVVVRSNGFRSNGFSIKWHLIFFTFDQMAFDLLDSIFLFSILWYGAPYFHFVNYIDQVFTKFHQNNIFYDKTN